MYAHALDDVSKFILYVAYREAVFRGKEHIDTAYLDKELANLPSSPGQVRLCIKSLIEDKYLEEDAIASLMTEGVSRVSITPEGVRLVEKELDDESSAVTKFRDHELNDLPAYKIEPTEHQDIAMIPASDRVVSVNHNSEPVKEARQSVDDLVEKLRLGNDLGNLTVEEADAAANEVYQLGLILDNENIRPAMIATFATTTLRWIADKAAGAVVGTMALSLLALLGAIFGIPL